MKDKTTVINYNPTPLREIIKKYSINQPLLAQAIGMNVNAFRNKLYQTQRSYYFTNAEYITILEALSAMANDIRSMIKRSAPGGSLKISDQNISKKSQKFRATPVLKSHEI